MTYSDEAPSERARHVGNSVRVLDWQLPPGLAGRTSAMSRHGLFRHEQS
jgi:hypothetical protein